MPVLPLRASKLDGVFVLLALAATGLMLTALLHGPGWGWEKWYLAHEETNYLAIVAVTENRVITKVDSFRDHMAVLGGQLLPLLALVWWYVRVWLPRQADPRPAGGRPWVALGLAVGCAAAVGGYLTGCFLSLPGTAALCFAYAKEGTLDTLHCVGFLLAACLLFGAGARYYAGAGFAGGVLRSPAAYLWAAGLVLFVFGMEEISWGQTWLGWETPPALAEINDQEETNLHNIFNEWLQIVYYGIGFAALAGTVGLLVLRDLARGHPLAEAVLPPRALLFAALWFPPASEVYMYSSSETFETLMTLYALGYALSVTGRARAMTGDGAPAPARAA